MVVEPRTWQLWLVFLLSLVGITWLKQQSLNDYWQQSYHSEGLVWYPPALLDNSKVFGVIQTTNKNLTDTLNAYFYQDVLALQKQEQLRLEAARIDEQKQALLAKEAAKAAQIPKPQTLTKVGLKQSQKVFFVGDSLMQGVAPWVMKELQNSHHIQSINLSKQSTGLSYDKFLDWPLTVESTFKQNPDIGLMVVFLGPNDPWAVPDPDKKGVFVPFDSPRWHELYHAKMQRLLDSAKAYNASVIWVAPPNAKKSALNRQMIALRAIMKSGLDPSQVLLINAQKVVGETEDTYADLLTIDGKPIKMRTSDGIHFTPEGQKRLAHAIMKTIEITP